MTAQAILLAAGRGERMRPLTDTCPKPLLPVRGKPLMQWHLEALARGGLTDVVVNTAWLEESISEKFEHHLVLKSLSNINSSLFNSEHIADLKISYSTEGRDFGGALETAGGIVRALPLLDEVFWVLAGDVFVPEFTFQTSAVERFIQSGKLAHLWLVPNPDHNLKGDFGLSPDGLALNLPKDSAQTKYTYSTMGLYRSALFKPPYCDIPAGNAAGVKAPLAPILRVAMTDGLVSAELYTGDWTDVGTPERLQCLNQGF